MSDVIVKECGCCGARYTAEGWVTLPHPPGGERQHFPADGDEPALTLEFRNCPCPGHPIPSTLVVEVETKEAFDACG